MIHDTYGVTLLGVRNVSDDGKEFWPEDAATCLGVPAPKRYRFGSMDEMLEFVSSRSPQEHEGIVVVDSQFRRIKLKNSAYVILNKLQTSTIASSPWALVELLLSERLDDFLPLAPPHTKVRALKMKEAFRQLLENYREAYASCLMNVEFLSSQRERERRKAFALAVQKHPNGWLAPRLARSYDATISREDNRPC